MKILFCSVVVLFCFSCSKPSAVAKKLSGCDSLVITFNVHNSDSIINIVNTTKKKAIRKLANFLKGDNTMQYKCGYDGSMVFYKKGEKLMAVVFNYTENGCRNFLYDMENILISTRMSNEAASFLESLAAGRSWY